MVVDDKSHDLKGCLTQFYSFMRSSEEKGQVVLGSIEINPTFSYLELRIKSSNKCDYESGLLLATLVPTVQCSEASKGKGRH
jgi:hypothetical protein